MSRDALRDSLMALPVVKLYLLRVKNTVPSFCNGLVCTCVSVRDGDKFSLLCEALKDKAVNLYLKISYK